MKMFERSTPTLRPVLLAAVGSLLAAASGGERQGVTAPMPEAYVRECGACHVPYPAGMLPAASWQRVMAGLERHYGTEASLDAATTRQLADWLQAGAGGGRRVREAPPQDRITRSAWFVREHDEIAPPVWTHPSVKSAANCAACHPRAERGVFDEHDLRVPAGLDRRRLGSRD